MSQIKISRWGTCAAGVYLLIIGILFVYATNCTETFCGLMAVLGGMPWLLILDLVGGDSYNAGFIGQIAIVANVIVLYFLFAALQKWLKK